MSFQIIHQPWEFNFLVEMFIKLKTGIIPPYLQQRQTDILSTQTNVSMGSTEEYYVLYPNNTRVQVVNSQALYQIFQLHKDGQSSVSQQQELQIQIIFMRCIHKTYKKTSNHTVMHIT